MDEEPLVIVKPDHILVADRVLGDIDSIIKGCGERVKTVIVKSVPLSVIQEHYKHHIDKPFYKYMTEYFAGKIVVLAVYHGDNIIAKIRDAIGDQDPVKAGPLKIRGKYSHDSLEDAIAQERPVKNVVHCSESRKEAVRERNVWKDYL